MGTFNTGAGSKKAWLRAAGIENVGLNTFRIVPREDEFRKKVEARKYQRNTSYTE